MAKKKFPNVNAGKYPRSNLPSKKILLIIPPKLLNEFRILCVKESYTTSEGIRESMRQMINKVLKNG
jgi:hypothetical protein